MRKRCQQIIPEHAEHAALIGYAMGQSLAAIPSKSGRARLKSQSSWVDRRPPNSQGEAFRGWARKQDRKASRVGSIEASRTASPRLFDPARSAPRVRQSKQRGELGQSMGARPQAGKLHKPRATTSVLIIGTSMAARGGRSGVWGNTCFVV